MSGQLRTFLEGLLEVTEKLLAKAAEDKERFRDDGINWGDLHCVSAQRVVNHESREWFRVVIEEVSPTATKLRQFISDELEARGYPDLEVSTEW